MATLPFGEYRPDMSDLNAEFTAQISNVVPRADGYAPWSGFESMTDILADECRGYFYARNRDGSVSIFAGTDDRLYLLNNTTLAWTDVSKGGTAYVAMAADAQWQFVQFNDFVIAVNPAVDPQVYDLVTSSEFDDLGGSPPKAAYVGVVNRFVVLTGLPDEPYRVHWSGLNDPEEWTSGTNSSDFQDLPDGGTARPVLGGEFGGIILQDHAIRRMTFSPGSETIFDIQRTTADTGCVAPYSACQAGDRGFFLSAKGWMMITGDGGLQPIGEERVNRTFFADADLSLSRLVIGVGDPNANVAVFTYKSIGNADEHFDKALVYNYVLQRWSPIAIEGEFIAPLASPGFTMESLAAIAPYAATVTGAANSGSGLIRLTVSSTSSWTTGEYKTVDSVGGTTEANGTWAITVVDGTHVDLQGSTFSNVYTSGGQVDGSLDDLSISLDAFAVSGSLRLSACNVDHQIGVFSGDALEATLETAEQHGEGRRLKTLGFYPLTDAATAMGSIAKRENLTDQATYTSEATMSASRGYCAVIRDTRYARVRLRIPEGTRWSYARGIVPEFTGMGRT